METSPSPPGSPPWARVVAYVIGLLVACDIAFFAGMAHFEEVTCGSGGECDLAGLEGMVWAVIVFVLGCLAALVNELRLARRRRRT